MSNITLELNINTSLYCALDNTIMEANTYDLLNNKLYGISIARNINTIDDYENVTDFKILDVGQNYLVTMISVKDRVHYITVDDTIETVIINMNKFETKALAKGLTVILPIAGSEAIYNKKKIEIWSKFLETLYEQVKQLNKHEWITINVDGYTLMNKANIIPIHAKLNNNNDVIIGFEIHKTDYNYFTKLNKLYNKSYIKLCEINIDNKKYVIEGKSRRNCLIKLYIELCRDNTKYKNINLEDIETKQYKILADAGSKCIYAILCTKEYLHNISLIDNKNNILSLENLIPKMVILGEKQFNNYIDIYNYIPEYISTNDSIKYKYDYAIVFFNIPRT